MATGITSIGDKFKIGDWVFLGDEVDKVGMVYDIIQDSLDDTMYSVKWLSDGTTFIYYCWELIFCDYTDFRDKIKDRVGEK